MAKVTDVGAESSDVGGDHSQVTTWEPVPTPPSVGLGVRFDGTASCINFYPAMERRSSWGGVLVVPAMLGIAGGPERAAA